METILEYGVLFTPEAQAVYDEIESIKNAADLEVAIQFNAEGLPGGGQSLEVPVELQTDQVDAFFENAEGRLQGLFSSNLNLADAVGDTEFQLGIVPTLDDRALEQEIQRAANASDFELEVNPTIPDEFANGFELEILPTIPDRVKNDFKLTLLDSFPPMVDLKVAADYTEIDEAAKLAAAIPTKKNFKLNTDSVRAGVGNLDLLLSKIPQANAGVAALRDNLGAASAAFSAGDLAADLGGLEGAAAKAAVRVAGLSALLAVSVKAVAELAESSIQRQASLGNTQAASLLAAEAAEAEALNAKYEEYLDIRSEVVLNGGLSSYILSVRDAVNEFRNIGQTARDVWIDFLANVGGVSPQEIDLPTPEVAKFREELDKLIESRTSLGVEPPNGFSEFLKAEADAADKSRASFDALRIAEEAWLATQERNGGVADLRFNRELTLARQELERQTRLLTEAERERAIERLTPDVTKEIEDLERVEAQLKDYSEAYNTLTARVTNGTATPEDIDRLEEINKRWDDALEKRKELLAPATVEIKPDAGDVADFIKEFETPLERYDRRMEETQKRIVELGREGTVEAGRAIQAVEDELQKSLAADRAAAERKEQELITAEREEQKRIAQETAELQREQTSVNTLDINSVAAAEQAADIFNQSLIGGLQAVDVNELFPAPEFNREENANAEDDVKAQSEVTEQTAEATQKALDNFASKLDKPLKLDDAGIKKSMEDTSKSFANSITEAIGEVFDVNLTCTVNQ